MRTLYGTVALLIVSVGQGAAAQGQFIGAESRSVHRAADDRPVAFSGVAKGSAEYRAVQARLARGWNTWDSTSVTNQVRLPDGLSIRLGVVHKAPIDHEDFLPGAQVAHGAWQADGSNKPPFGAEQVTPGAHAYDGSYTEAMLVWHGHRMTIESAHVAGDLVLMVTPLPSAAPTGNAALDAGPLPPVLIAQVGYLWNRTGSTARTEMGVEARSAASITPVFSTATLSPMAQAVPISGPYIAAALDQAVGLSTGRPRSLEEVRTAIARAKQAFVASNGPAGELSRIKEALQSVIAWNTIYEPQGGRVLTPLARSWTPDFGGVVMFAWDSFFTAQLAGVGNRDLGYANMLETLAAITPEGMVPAIQRADGVITPRSSQPPVAAIALWDMYQRYGDKWFLRDAFEPLLAWNRWRARERDIQGYLVFAGESGLDNSVLDDPPVQSEKSGQHRILLADVALMSEYIVDCRVLSRVATILGRHAEATELSARGHKYANALKTLWDNKDGIFKNRDLVTGKLVDRLAPNMFYPMMAHVATEAQARRMVRDHLLNPKQFWGEWVLPSAARDEAAYKDQDYWRGRIWGPMNFMTYLGLLNYDQPEARRLLAAKGHRLFMLEWDPGRRAYETFNADDGHGAYDVPGGTLSSDPLYNWSLLLPYAQLLERTNSNFRLP